MKYCNPVYLGYMADPFVLQHEGVYWAYGTGGPENGGRQKDGRFYPVLRSKDLVHWDYVGGALIGLDNPSLTDYWAPELAFKDGLFFLYYSAGKHDGEGHQIRVATSRRPEGPFHDSGHILLPDEPFSIDPHPFRDPQTGHWWLFFAKDYFNERVGTGTAMIRLADNMLGVVGELRTAVRAHADWQIFQRRRFWYGRVWDAWHTVEGPFVLFHAGKYYCLYSGGCWETPDYGVGFATADQVTGPWRDTQNSQGPMLLRGATAPNGPLPHHEEPAAAGGLFGPGHNSVILGPDGKTPWLVYHAWDAQRTKRRMCIDRLLWTPDGPRCAGPTWHPQEMPLT